MLFLIRSALTVGLMSVGAVTMVFVALVTGFSRPRLYRETLAAGLGRLTLRLWGIRLLVHGEWPGQPGAQTTPPAQLIYISNHSSTIDMFVLLALALPNCRFFLSGYLRKVLPIAVIGYLTGIFWTVPQDYPERRRRLFIRAERVLRHSGESVYLSPEGQRITGGRIGDFNRGAFHLATALGIPIVPLLIRIPPQSDPGTGLKAQPGVVEVFVDEPIDTAQWRVDSVDWHKVQVREKYVAWHRDKLSARGVTYG